MARIPLLSPGDPGFDPKAEALMGAVEQRYGTTFNVIRGLANHSDALEAFMNLQGVVFGPGRSACRE